MSVGSSPNLAEEQEQRAHPSLRRHSVSHIPAAERRSRIHISGLLHHITLIITLMISVDGCTEDMNQTLLRMRHVLKNDSLDYKEAQK